MTKPKRYHCTVTMQQDLHDQVRERCKQEDKPLTVWVRDLIKRELAADRFTVVHKTRS